MKWQYKFVVDRKLSLYQLVPCSTNICCLLMLSCSMHVVSCWTEVRLGTAGDFQEQINRKIHNRYRIVHLLVLIMPVNQLTVHGTNNMK